MIKTIILSTLTLSFLTFNTVIAKTSAENSDYPGRNTYRNVNHISTADLYKKKDNVTIVDTRSDYEYETLSIKGAVSIPLTSLDFKDRIKQLYKDEGKPLVFYCNGHSCMKSYQAVVKTKRLAKITDSYAYDSGIFDWAHAYPEESVLLGKSPINPTDLIPKKEFARHLLKPEVFAKQVDKNCLVLDVRDPIQRLDRLFPGNQRSVSLDKSEQKKLNNYIEQSKREKKSLCIYDAVGKQVRWMQYYLKAKNITNYYFMEGGAKAFYDMS